MEFVLVLEESKYLLDNLEFFELCWRLINDFKYSGVLWCTVLWALSMLLYLDRNLNPFFYPYLIQSIYEEAIVIAVSVDIEGRHLYF